MATKSTKSDNGPAGTTNRLATPADGEAIFQATNALEGGGNLQVFPPEIIRVRFTIVGITPLIICHMSKKSRDQIINSGKGGRGKAKQEKVFDPPEVEMNHARHISTEGWDGIHAAAFKGAFVDAARSVKGLPMTNVKRAARIVAQGTNAETKEPLVKIIGPPPTLFSNFCRSKAGDPLPRNRPIYNEWGAEVEMVLNGAILSKESASNLFAIAGQFGGVGDWRMGSPESNTGDFGCWEVVNAVELDNTEGQMRVGRSGG